MTLYQRLQGAVGAARKAWNSGGEVSMSEIMELFTSSAGGGEAGADLSEITYFTCLKTLAESLGKMPVYLMDKDKHRIMQHESMWAFSARPNSYMTPIQLFTTLEYWRNHYGNAYAYISRNPDGSLQGIYPLNPMCVQIWVNNTENITHWQYFYHYTDTRSGKSYWLDPEEVLHFKSWLTTPDGLSGKSVREILAASFAGAKAGTKFLNDLYRKGLTANAVVKHVGDLKPEAQKKLLDRIEEQAREKGRRMITLPVGFDIQTLDLKLTDSQFYELKKYNALQIAAAFGVKPDHLNDYSKSSYANSSMQQLSFYIDTLLYIVTIYEQELNRKLLMRKELQAGMGYKFNVAVILRGDPTQQADVLQKMVQSGIYSVNDALSFLDRPPCENGDVHMVNGSYVKLEDIGKAYENRKGGEDDAQNQEPEK